MQGLTLDEVAAKLGGMVTKQAISKYERGLMAPSPAVLSALSKIYGVDLRESVPSSVYVTASWNFRRGQNMPAKIESAVKNNIIYCLEKYLGVEKRLGLSSIFRSPFPKDYPATRWKAWKKQLCLSGKNGNLALILFHTSAVC